MEIRGRNGDVLSFTQVVSEADIAAGRIRIPSVGNVKGLFPAERCRVDVTVNGNRIDAAWDPRMGPDQERSGALGVQHDQLHALVRPGEVLRVYRSRYDKLFVGERGSKLRLQQWVNRHRPELNACLRSKSRTLEDFLQEDPKWISPLGHPEWTTTPAPEPYYEFKADFWSALELPRPAPNPEFWPDLGPNWDGMAALVGPDDQIGVLLVEAKSHLTEPESSCSAKLHGGRTQIMKALDATKRYLAAEESANWLEGFYQLANRLAFLYYLRARRNIPAWLALINFVGDGFDGSKSTFPNDDDGWAETNQAIIKHLGLPDCHGLSPYLVSIYPHAAGPSEPT